MSKREEIKRLADLMGDAIVEKVYDFIRAGGVYEPTLSPGPELTDADLEALTTMTEAATPGPWYVRGLDDSHAMGLIAVSTVDDDRHLRWPDFDHREIVAATLIQEPRYVDHASDRCDEDALFIATARMAMPRLLAEVRSLRAKLANRAGP